MLAQQLFLNILFFFPLTLFGDSLRPMSAMPGFVGMVNYKCETRSTAAWSHPNYEACVLTLQCRCAMDEMDMKFDLKLPHLSREST